MAPGLNEALYVLIPRSDDSVLVLLDRDGKPRAGWPIAVDQSGACGLLLAVADGVGAPWLRPLGVRVRREWPTDGGLAGQPRRICRPDDRRKADDPDWSCQRGLDHQHRC